AGRGGAAERTVCLPRVANACGQHGADVVGARVDVEGTFRGLAWSADESGNPNASRRSDEGRASPTFRWTDAFRCGDVWSIGQVRAFPLTLSLRSILGCLCIQGPAWQP